MKQGKKRKERLWRELYLQTKRGWTNPVKRSRLTFPSLLGNVIPYVSRGGLKLEKAIQQFQLNLKDKVLLDIGASTGGFTDCALQHGARLSYALDVGYNQLAWKLRQDERVVVMERTNFRYVTPDAFPIKPEMAVIDVSFISLTLILPVLKNILVPKSDVIALIKPQFEAGKDQVGKKGIIRDAKIHEEVIIKIKEFAISEGYDVKNLAFSPITGGEGNIEFLIHLRYEGEKETGSDDTSEEAADIVQQAHSQLNKPQ